MKPDPKFGKKMNKIARDALKRIDKEELELARHQNENEASKILKVIPKLANSGHLSFRFEIEHGDVNAVADILNMGYGLNCENKSSAENRKANELDVCWAYKETA